MSFKDFLTEGTAQSSAIKALDVKKFTMDELKVALKQGSDSKTQEADVASYKVAKYTGWNQRERGHVFHYVWEERFKKGEPDRFNISALLVYIDESGKVVAEHFGRAVETGLYEDDAVEALNDIQEV